MMDMESFNYSFKKIRAKWKTTFTDDMALQVFDIVKNVPSYDFAKWVDSILWVQHSPTRDAFYELANRFKPKKLNDIGYTDCTECDGKGNMLVEDPQGYEFWFACISCIDGPKKHKDLPRWKPGWLAQGWKIIRSQTMKDVS